MANQKLIASIGENIKQLRLAKAKGQTEVARALDISVAALSKIENGQTDINVSRLAQLAKYFEVSINAIITRQETSSVSQEVIEEIADLKKQLADKDAEVMKLQKKVIDLYDKLGL
jgi:transcriptional regulator with XRE-family HTH domain